MIERDDNIPPLAELLAELAQRAHHRRGPAGGGGMMLADLQRDFRAWLTTGTDEVAERFGTGAAAGLSVYQNNYRSQLVGCLEQSFPQVRLWLGEEAFRSACVGHIDAHPPHAWTLDAYAQSFPATIGQLYPDNPDLHELAWIELALSEAFVGPDAEPLSAEALGAIDWDTARLKLAPTFAMRAAATNAEEVWTSLQEQETAAESVMLDEPGGLIVWRRGYSAYLRQVDGLEYEALQEMGRSGSFVALCAQLVGKLGEDSGVAKAAEFLAQWLGGGLIVE